MIRSLKLNKMGLLVALLTFVLVFAVSCGNNTQADEIKTPVSKHTANISEATVLPSVSSRVYQSKNPNACSARGVDEAKIYSRLSTKDIKSKRLQFLINVAVCNDVLGNHSLALRDVKSVIYLSEIYEMKSESYTIALSILASHELSNLDEKAWSYNKLANENLQFYGHSHRSFEKDRAINSAKATTQDMFYSQKRFGKLEQN